MKKSNEFKDNLKTSNQKSKVVPTPIFGTTEDEKMFFEAAKKVMSSKTGLHWEGKHDDER